MVDGVDLMWLNGKQIIDGHLMVSSLAIKLIVDRI